MAPISLRLNSREHQTALPGGFALGRMGFRPFFLLAALFAVGAVPSWLLVLDGRIALSNRGGPLLWHSHEMLFGYTVAVIAGFLLTAASRWTGRVTAVGGPLYALAGLWVLGRTALLFGDALPGAVVAVVDLSFLPALMVVVGRPLVATENRRNYFLLGILGGLWIANGATHLEMTGLLPGAAAWGTRLALNLITAILLIIGARVIPMFTRNATRQESIRSSPRLEVATAVLVALLTVAEAALAPLLVRVVLGAAAALCALASMGRWGTGASFRQPLLWVLHLGYLWVPVALLLRSAELAGAPIAPSASIHALTAGAIGTLTLGMMSRVTLGHTGRLIVACPLTAACFVLVSLAAALRVIGPELFAEHVRDVWMLSGAAWVLAFALYLARYAPMLLSPRVDGGAG